MVGGNQNRGIHNLNPFRVSQLAVAMGENLRVLVDLDCVPCEEETRQRQQETKGQKMKNCNKSRKIKMNKRPKNLLRRAARKGQKRVLALM